MNTGLRPILESGLGENHPAINAINAGIAVQHIQELRCISDVNIII
jgi:hypothetical protein